MTQSYFPDGRFFEDFTLGETLAHATPRTLSDGDGALYQALYGGRNPLASSTPFAQQLGHPARPLEDWLVFHIVFGKTVPDVSRHALANLGYGEGFFGAPVFAGDTLSASSQVIGLRENKSGETGIVMVRTRGVNQQGAEVLSYVRWVMAVSYTHLRAHETKANLVCRLLLEKKKKNNKKIFVYNDRRKEFIHRLDQDLLTKQRMHTVQPHRFTYQHHYTYM